MKINKIYSLSKTLFLILFVSINMSMMSQNGLHFNGSSGYNDDHVSIPHHSTFNLTALTFESWVYWNGNGAISNLFMKTGNSGIGDYGYGVGIRSDGYIEWWQQYSGFAGPNSSSNPVTANTWTHIAVTVVDGGDVNFYVNGVLSGTVSGALIVNGTKELIIGKQGPHDNYFNGIMDEFRLWNKVKTQAEIVADMDCEIPTSASGLLVNYHFNQGVAAGNNTSVTNLTDASGNNHNGTLNNLTLTGSTSNWVTSREFNCNNKSSLYFDGVNDHLRIAHNSKLNPSTEMTIEAWVYRTANQYGTVVSKYEDDGNNRGYMINFGEMGDASKLCFIATNTGNWLPNPKIQWETNASLNLNQWYHVAITFTQNGTNNLKYYLDGVLTDQTTWNYSINPTPADLYIGGYDGWTNGFNAGANSRYFAGKLDEVRIWNKARSSSQIYENKNKEISSEKNLIAYYKFNEGIADADNSSINTANDASKNNHNATINNFAKTGTSSNYSDQFKFKKIKKENSTFLLDFNNYTVGNINGQDNWLSVKNLTSNDIEVVDSLGPDKTRALTQKAFGANVFVNGNKNISSIFNNTGFKDSNASYQITYDVVQNYWGINFVVGYDANADGKISIGDATEVALRTEFRTEGSGVGFMTTPSTTKGLDSLIKNYNWHNVKIKIQNMKKGGMADIESYDYVTGKTRGVYNIPLGLDYNSTGKLNPANWNILGLSFQTSDAKIDNIKFEKTLELACKNDSINDVRAACDSFKWIDGNTYTDNNSVASIKYTNEYGCDSIVTLKLTINKINPATTNTNQTITATESGATYQWIDCDSNKIISGANNQSFTTNKNGNFAVIITKNGCSDTSNCVSMNKVGLNNFYTISNTSIYPNPASSVLNVQSNLTIKNLQYEIFDLFGKSVKSGVLVNENDLIDINSLSNGTYNLKINEMNIRFVKIN